jgi:hypothetical protein
VLLALLLTLGLGITNGGVHYENHNYRDVNQFFHFIAFVWSVVYLLPEVVFQEVHGSFVKGFKLIFANTGEQDVLSSEEAQNVV